MKKGYEIKKYMKIIISISIILILLIYENFTMKITNKSIIDKNIPSEFNGYRILQISDFYNKNFHKKDYFIKKVGKTNPDIIFITGDIINSRNPNYDIVEKMLINIVKIAPVYYVTGNHESRLEDFPSFFKKMEKIGINILNDDFKIIKRKNDELNIIGVNDPMYFGEKHLYSKLEEYKEKNKYNILLSHRPELFENYVKHGMNLVFTGHTHGGQIRIPFLGAVFAPNQGIFPKYAEGIHKKEDTNMIINKGIGSSLIPIRIFNRAEIVVLTIFNEK